MEITSNESLNQKTKNNSERKNLNFIKLSNKKRNRDILYKENTDNKNLVLFESKFLPFKQFANKIKEELKNHKMGKQIFSKSTIPEFNKNNINSLLIEHDLNYNEINIRPRNNMTLINSNNSSPKHINDNNEKNFIYQTNKKLKNKQINIHPLSSQSKQRAIGIIDNYIHKENNDNNLILVKNIETTPIYKNGKIKMKSIYIYLICGITIMMIVLYISKDKSNSEIKKSLNNVSISFSIKIIFLILVIMIILLIYYKNKKMLLYKNISLEDFELLKKLLYENYSENKVELNKGIIKNIFISDCSSKRKLSEEKYIKHILPMLYELIDQFNYDNNNIINDCKFIIDESDVIISGQKVKLWSFSQK